MLTDAVFDDKPIVNPMQLIVLDCAVTGGLIAALKIGGVGWVGAVLTGWFGGAILTAGLLFGATYLVMKPVAMRGKSKTSKQKLDPASITARRKAETQAAWDADLAAEREHWAREAQVRKNLQQSARGAAEEAIRMWEEDARNDSKENQIQSDRTFTGCRRQVNIEVAAPYERRRSS